MKISSFSRIGLAKGARQISLFGKNRPFWVCANGRKPVLPLWNPKRGMPFMA